MDWINSDEFATIAGISARKARQASSRSLAGLSWRDAELEVRVVFGRGGKSGKQYQVKVSSLPAHLQERLKALQITDEAISKLRFGEPAQLERNWKQHVIRHALAHPRGSSGRKAEIDRLHDTVELDWTGKHLRLSRTTLYKWIQAHEELGVHHLARRIRSDKGSKKVFISRAWSNAVPFTDATKSTIQADLKQYARSLIKRDGQLKQTLVLTSEKLKEITRAYRFCFKDSASEDEACRIPRAFVDEEAQYKAVARHQKDRKASEDDKPRIIRTSGDRVPMELVVMDVHHINVHVLREDGTYSTPKLIAFHDVVTNRVFCELIQFSDRGGVRNADIITAFVNMCQHPAFGMPQVLYGDNGSEYGWADDLEDALKLGVSIKCFETREDRDLNSP